jgi:ligand-binding sensor domain-containing protein
LLSDRRGRLWLAKDGGTVLCVEADKITQAFALAEKSHSAPDRRMAEDAQGSVWISDSTGCVFRIQEGKAQAFGRTEGLPGQDICWLTTDVRGQLWFSQAGRVGVFRDGRFVTLFTLGQQSVRIALARGGGVWLCSGLRFFRYQDGGELKAVAELKLESGVVEVAVTALYEDKAHGLWIGTSSGSLFRFDSQGIQSVQTSHPNIINILENSEGNLWVGTRGGGLNRLSPRAVRLLDRASGLPFAVSLSGSKVTNFVSPVASSFIQMVSTRKTRPFGPVNIPRIRYLGPYSVWSNSSASCGRSCVRMSLSNRSAFSRV